MICYSRLDGGPGLMHLLPSSRVLVWLSSMILISLAIIREPIQSEFLFSRIKVKRSMATLSSSAANLWSVVFAIEIIVSDDRPEETELNY